MGLFYNDAHDVEFELEVENGTGGQKRPVHGLASSIVATFTAIKAAVELVADLIVSDKLAVVDADVGEKLDLVIEGLVTVDGDLVTPRLSTVIGHVDGLEGKLDTLHTDLTTIDGRVDGVETLLGTVNTNLATIDGHVDGLEGALATVNANLTTIDGRVDGVETLLGTVNTNLTAIDGHVDGLETKADATNTKLDTLITGVVVATMPTPANSYGASNVGSSATQIASGASLALKYGIRIKNTHATQDLYVGFDNSTSNTTGVKLRPGEEAPFIVANRNVIYLYGSGATTTYCYWTA